MAGVSKKIMDWPEGATTATRALDPELCRSLAHQVIAYLEAQGLPDGTVTIEADVTVRIMAIAEYVHAPGPGQSLGAAGTDGPGLFGDLLSGERRTNERGE